MKLAQPLFPVDEAWDRSELWLGEDDALSSSRYMWAHAEQTADDLIAVTQRYPGIKGFNLDLESGHGTDEDLENYVKFLGVVGEKLQSSWVASHYRRSLLRRRLGGTAIILNAKN